jgi:diguanylate cyclase (GGDEF)-like protein
MTLWSALLTGQQRTEHAQSIARLVIAGAFLVYLVSRGLLAPEDPVWAHATGISIGYLVTAVLLYVSIQLRPAPSPFRRGASVPLDIGVLSTFLYLLGPEAAFAYPLYLWIIVGNGLRFGVPYLFYALAVGVAGFLATMILSPYWHTQPSLAFGLLAGLVILPLFYASLLRELESANRQLARQVDETAHAATHDPLTGLANRVLLLDRLNLVVEQARRRNTRVAVMFLDLDAFKEINDRLGHHAGDELLRQVAGRLTEQLRRADTIARFGGDEFVVLFDSLQNDTDTEAATERLVSVFDAPFVIAGTPQPVTGSIGMALFPFDGADADSLLRNADRAMYHAKELGRNRCERYSRDLG